MDFVCSAFGGQMCSAVNSIRHGIHAGSRFVEMAKSEQHISSSKNWL
ncbi:hypothetical protein ACQ4M3_28435 [Leptolyngbya sp. AN03gr2]